MKVVRLNESSDIVFDLGESVEEKQKLLKEGSNGNKKLTLQTRIEAIHETITKNNIRYPADRLKGDPDFIREGRKNPTGAHSWTRPYPKPMLINHNTRSKPLGRIIDAQFVEKTTDGRPGIEVVVELSDQEAIEMVQDGRYYTVSIGADTDALYCSICGENVIESEECSHWKGNVYEGKKCHWSVGNLWFHELSFVNIPADDMARVINPGKVSKKSNNQESFEDDIFIIDEESRMIKPIIEFSESTGVEEFILSEEKKNKTHEETPVEEPIENQNPEETNADPVNKGDSTNSEEVAEEVKTLKEKISELESNLNSVNESYKKVLEALLKIVQDAGFAESSPSAENPEAESAETATDLQTKLESLEAEISALREEKQELADKAVDLQSQIRKDLVEKVVDLKIKLGLISEEKRDDEIEAHALRSEESLNDTLSDLLAERDSEEKPSVRKTITNPGLADNSQEGVIETDTDDTDTKEDNHELTASDVIKHLLVGKKDI